MVRVVTTKQRNQVVPMVTTSHILSFIKLPIFTKI